MDIEAIVEEQTKKAAVINNLAIYWDLIKQIAPQVLNGTATITPEYQKTCTSVITLCERVEENIKELKTMIPGYNN